MVCTVLVLHYDVQKRGKKKRIFVEEFCLFTLPSSQKRRRRRRRRFGQPTKTLCWCCVKNMTSSPHATTTLPSFSSQKEKSAFEKREGPSSSSSLESHFTLSKSRVNDAVETLEKNILENTRKRERELVEKKTLIDRLYERLELTRKMVAEGE